MTMKIPSRNMKNAPMGIVNPVAAYLRDRDNESIYNLYNTLTTNQP